MFRLIKLKILANEEEMVYFCTDFGEPIFRQSSVRVNKFHIYIWLLACLLTSLVASCSTSAIREGRGGDSTKSAQVKLKTSNKKTADQLLNEDLEAGNH